MRASGAATRVLPHSPDPLPGEALFSYLDRTAEEHEASRLQLWRWTGLTPPDRNWAPHFYGVAFPPEHLRLLARSLRRNPRDLLSMTLSVWDGTAVNLDRLDPADPMSVRGWLRTHWAYQWQSNMCPECLAQLPAWSLKWRLAYNFACSRHGSLLLAVCGYCGGRWQRHVKERAQHVMCCSRVESESGPYSAGGRLPPPRRPFCGREAASQPPIRLTDMRLLSVQRTLDELLAVESTGDTAAARTVLTSLRSLLPFVLYTAAAHQISTSDQVVASAWSAHVAARDEAGPRQGARATAGYRNFSLPGHEPALVAAAVSLALPLALAEAREAETLWVQYCDAAVQSDMARIRLTQITKFWQPPDTATRNFHVARARAVAPAVSFLDGRSRHRNAHIAPERQRWSSTHLPQLIWASLYARLLDNLTPGTSEILARRYLSMAAARLLEPETPNWYGAAAALRLPDSVVASGNRLRAGLGADGCAALEDRLATLLNDMRAAEPHIDYGARRRVLHDWDMPEQVWLDVLEASEQKADRAAVAARIEAAAWVWVHLTGGDWHFAPSLRLDELPVPSRQVQTNRYVQYFVGRRLARVQPALLQYASLLLEEQGLGGPSTWDPFRA